MKRLAGIMAIVIIMVFFTLPVTAQGPPGGEASGANKRSGLSGWERDEYGS